jgi:hypothetical protein
MRSKNISGVKTVLLVVILSTLIAARLLLSSWAVKYVNTQIAQLKGYDGSIQDLDIALWRGAYQIHGLNIYKTNGSRKEPFVAAKTIDLSIEWRALFHGKIVAEADINTIDFNFSIHQTGMGIDWGKFIDSLSPFDINRMSVNGGKVAYHDHQARPEVNIYITGINGIVTNLRNVEAREVALPSALKMAGTSIGKGAFDLQGRINIIQAVPDFDLDIKLRNAALPAFNNFTHAAAGVRFASGTASVYSELAAAKGNLTGYVKFIATDIAVKAPDIKDGNIVSVVWTALAATFIEIFKNHPRDQFALRIPIEGNIKDPQKDGWGAFFSIFRNAFIKAFTKNTDGTISFIDALRKE